MPPEDDSDLRTDARVCNEQVLARELSVGQQAMMAIGGAIGTGLFLGSGLAVQVAGPAVVASYVIGSLVSLLLGAALTEMCVMHPTAGSFGVHADLYVSPFAGYAVRMSYWLMQIVATGGHMVAVSIYMGYWFPTVPGAVWVVVFSAALIYVNTLSVGIFGRFEYWFAMIKIAAIVLFVGVGASLIVGPGHTTPIQHGPLLPMGVSGILLGVSFVIYSFVGVEIVGVTSGEARNPVRTIPRAFARLVASLSLIYVVTTALLVALVPWRQLGVGESPFVQVLAGVGLPGAAFVMNVVVVSAALSSANANLYLISRTLFSLGRSGLVPGWLGVVNAHGTPVRALLVSSLGLAFAVVVRAAWPGSAYTWFFGVALFGALFVWLMIFVTHLAFRRYWDRRDPGALPVRVPWSRAASLIGAAAVAAILLSTWWVPELKITLVAAGPWMLVLAAGYAFATRGRAASSPH
jgi:AAT family amino acid transporter